MPYLQLGAFRPFDGLAADPTWLTTCLSFGIYILHTPNHAHTYVMHMSVLHLTESVAALQGFDPLSITMAV